MDAQGKTLQPRALEEHHQQHQHQQEHQQQEDTGKYKEHALEKEGDTQETHTLRPTQQDGTVIKADQVEAAVRQDQGSNARLESWVAENFTAPGDNYLGSLLRLKVTYHKEGLTGHTSYVAKVRPSSTTMKEFMDVAHRKECLVYSVLVPLLNDELQAVGHDPVRLPRCIFCSDECGKEIIILEDLGRRGFRMADRRQGLSIRQAELVVQELARLHAASHMLQTSRPSIISDDHYAILTKDWHNYSPEADGEIGAMLRCDLHSLANVAEAAGGYEAAVAWLRQAAPWAMEMFKKQVTDTAKPFRVLCHGDCWTNNFMFRYDGDGTPVDVALIDLQLCRWGSLALDINTIAYTSIDFKTRIAGLSALLSTYFKTFSEVLLSSHLPCPFTHDQLLQQCRDKSAFALLMGADYLPALLLEEDDIFDYNILGHGEEEWVKHVEHKLRDVLPRNPTLQSALLTLIEDLSMLGIIGGPLSTYK